jgi:KaiC/GvpD/RAD55 family RecA-like ATPase
MATQIPVLKTGITGFDNLLAIGGFEPSNVVLVSGGCGSGKSLFTLQFLYNGAMNGEKCLHIGFQEPPEKLRAIAGRFGMDLAACEKKGNLILSRINPFQLAKLIEAKLMQTKGKLKIEFGKQGILEMVPKGFVPTRIVIDSLSSLSVAFQDQQEVYRRYIDHLFRTFAETNAVTLAIAETEQEPSKYSRTGIEEFVADGVLVLYNIGKEGSRVRALEVLKMRGTDHHKGLIPLEITNKGMVIHPQEKVF